MRKIEQKLDYVAFMTKTLVDAEPLIIEQHH
jgi:hypothetical protein